MKQKLNGNSQGITRTLLKKNGIRVRQFMPGRIRAQVLSCRQDTQKASWMQKFINRQVGVRKTEVRPPSGSVIILFDPYKTDLGNLMLAVLAQVAHPVSFPDDDPASTYGPACTSCLCETHQDASSPVKARRVAWLTSVMVFALVRKWIFGLALAQTPLSFLGIAAMAGTVPLIKEAVKDTAEKRKVTVKPFLAAGSVATILMGEAFSAIQILWIYNVAELTEDYVAQRSRKAIRNILEVAPATAYVMRDGMEVETQVADIRPDDVVAAHTGEKIPVDGTILDGDALVDEATINGRSEAVFKDIGDKVYAGTIISQGTLFIRTVKTGQDTYLAGIMRMVENSLANKAPAEQKADELAARLLKIGLAATAATLALTLDPLRALTVMLVMSCPCATVLAASSAVTAALANAAKHSILIKGGLYLETVGKTDVYCFDKTGTLTQDLPQIMTIVGRTPSISEDTILSLAATAESHNQHPMARAILAEAQKRNLTIQAHAVCEFKAGRGVSCNIGCEEVVLVGNRQFMDENEVDLRWFDKKAAAQRALGRTVIFVSKNGSATGMMGIANPIRPEAVEVLNDLKADGVKSIHLVTGDNKEVAQTMMDIFHFDDCRAPLLPEEKADRVAELQKEHRVVMVGDGVNDALALARADIGVAIGAGGAEVALEAADIALADSNLEGLIKVRNLSHQTMKVIDQNHYFAISTDLGGAALGMLGMLSPVMAGMIHIFHTAGILVNSSRLLSWEPPSKPMYQLPDATHNKT
ncbi:cation-translocating P-type ATPase [uncultured Desulfobacter sp.]|uniref:heavy metal translocating P-type ATPase n=1 Tax=uncultured Desulfobacter sp. TaxID=240139 RepID=UPI002AAAD41C|nr:cation-translocating P-type ATPase [uncultured Desulfobacter sp.]